MTHTPTPWTATGTIIFAPDDRKLGAVYAHSNVGRGFTLDEAVDNAAHIVRCVNAHDELVAALTKIASGNAHGYAEEIARAALAKVQP